MNSTTIRDVARLAKVSISTVSRVMNMPEAVAPDKRERVLEAIRRLEYQPNGFARGLIFKKSNTLGVLIPDIRNPYYGDIIRGMEEAAKQFGYSLMICNTDRDPERVVGYIEDLREKQVDGLLFASDYVTALYYETIRKSGVPVVLVSTESREYGIPSVKVDEEQAAYEAVRHLIALGHREIGIVCFTLPDPISGEPRYRGYARALEEAGLEGSKNHVVYATHWFEEAYAATDVLFQRYPQLTAVFACSDEFALGVISCLHDRGIKVPDQVSVIGFDNVRLSRMSIPRLSTIAQPMYEIGYAGVSKLHRLVRNESLETLRDIVPHRLIVRESTGPPGGSGENRKTIDIRTNDSF
ncbi:LacI family DNA-binding transcriptional regulator [Paenibacillus thailandensis]|uniref:LacI family DNA-binding transcriptional regulator n=1 Tax=Paenibacillus thailandensis TaxID=393250 RepID=A0ABW5QWJ2_9BACL